MKKVIPVFSALIILSTLLCLYFFRQLPSGELWRGYSVLYVPESVSDSTVVSALENAGITEYTCLSNQYLPVTLSADSPEITLLSLNQASADYLQRRNNFFFDKNHNYKLFYIPVFYKNRLSSVQNTLNKTVNNSVDGKKLYCGIDSKSAYPALFPVLALVFASVLLLFSKKKKLYAGLVLLPVLYTVSFPYLSSVISAFILLVYFFIISNVFGRRDFMKIIFRKKIFHFLLLLAVVSVVSSGFLAALVFVLLIISELSVFYLYRHVQVKTYKASRFNPVMIRSSFAVPLYGGKENLVFGILSVFTLISFVFSLLFFNVSSGGENSSSSPALPSVNAREKSFDLPELEEFYQWNFIVSSFPYRSLNESGLNGTVLSPVKISSFQKENGRIVEDDYILEYSDAYRNSVYGSIDSLNFNALEKILKKQGESSVFGYASNGSYRLSLFCIIITFLEFTLIILYFSWILINKSLRNRPKINKQGRGRK